MKRLICLILILLFIPACSNNLETKSLFYIQSRDDAYYIISADGRINNKIQIDKRIRGLKILPDGKSFIIDVLNSPGSNIDSNALFMMTSSGRAENITKGYASEEPKVSPDGLRIAYTAYSADDLNSYQGIYLSDMKGNIEKVNTQKRITQGLYEWLDKDELLFYGIDIENKDLSKMYKYNVNSKSESIFYDGIEGYCSFFTVDTVNNLLIIDDGSVSERKLRIIDLKTKSSRRLNFLYDTVYDMSISPDGKYAAIAANETSEDKTHLFIYNIKEDKLEMSLTDYPDEVIQKKGYLVWDQSKLYFCGKTDEKYSVCCLDMISREIKSITEDSNNCLYPQKTGK